MQGAAFKEAIVQPIIAIENADALTEEDTVPGAT